MVITPVFERKNMCDFSYWYIVSDRKKAGSSNVKRVQALR
jgi:elongation factor P hydroxylase